jgi:hypothetical protein
MELRHDEGGDSLRSSFLRFAEDGADALDGVATVMDMKEITRHSRAL